MFIIDGSFAHARILFTVLETITINQKSIGKTTWRLWYRQLLSTKRSHLNLNISGPSSRFDELFLLFKDDHRFDSRRGLRLFVCPTIVTSTLRIGRVFFNETASSPFLDNRKGARDSRERELSTARRDWNEEKKTRTPHIRSKFRLFHSAILAGPFDYPERDC